MSTPPPSSPAAVAAASAQSRQFNVEATSKYCEGGQTCLLPDECCPQGCCFVYSQNGARPTPPGPPTIVALIFWNHWYLWLLLLLVLASCVGGCGLYRRRRHLHSACCVPPARHLAAMARAGGGGGGAGSDRSGSPGSCCAPPHYSRCASLHIAPPPYTEVTSKPDLYPLVISYGNDGEAVGLEGSKTTPGGGGSYLMVQYFRNYIVRPIGSLSAASTVDSLSSGFLCSAANEANSMVPPPYSCTGSLDEFGVPSVPSATPQQQSFVSATALSAATASEASSLAGGTASPPRATSPTLELRSLLGRISRAYLPLPPAPPPPPRCWLSRSAPATPCSALLPPLPTQDGSPLLAEVTSDMEDEDRHV